MAYKSKSRSPKSTSKKAKGIIRNAIHTYYGPKAFGGGKSTALYMQADANVAHDFRKGRKSAWRWVKISSK